MKEKGVDHTPGGVLDCQEGVKSLINLYLCEWIKYAYFISFYIIYPNFVFDWEIVYVNIYVRVVIIYI